MTNEELCMRYQAGDTDAAEELISENMGFIRSLALRYDHNFHSPRMDADDYTQEGPTALLRAASQFDPAQQVHFLSYAGLAVRNAIIDAIRAGNPNAVLLVFDDARPGESDDEDDHADQFIGSLKTRLPRTYKTDPEHIYIQKEKLEKLYSAILALSPRHHAWVMCRYGFDDEIYKSLAEMGRIYHLSESRAKKTEDEAIGRLRKELNPAFR